jgi:asparagine synthase (glutamine-hydrolysing)
LSIKSLNIKNTLKKMLNLRMCGIVGIWDPSHQWSFEVKHQFIERLSNAIRLRGPDDSGLWHDESSGIMLAQRRLSIVDLSPTGHQPMVSASGRYVLIYNGEIYNAQDYRGNFSQLRGTSDTEVLLEACEAWGPEEACRRFRGMFAFALWDQSQRHLYLARDRVGVKPLYWGVINSVVIFGSELKAMSSCPGWSAPLCQAALSSFIQLGYVIDPLAIYEGFNKLTPGTILQFKGAVSMSEHVFWDHASIVSSALPSVRSVQEHVQEVERLLIDNVERRMLCDVPVGSFLSGGIDSGLVTAIMQHRQQTLSAAPVRSYSIGFSEAAYNEAPQAEQIAQHVGTHHRTAYMTGHDALTVLQEALWDEPFADSSQLCTAFVCKQARQDGVIVCLSGDGGDEVFAGYNRYLSLDALHRYFAWMPNWARSWISALGLKLPGMGRYPRLQKAFKVLAPQELSKVYQMMCCHYPLDNIWSLPLLPIPFPTLYCQDAVFSMQYWDVLSYLPGDILTKVDRASMAYSLEVRSPFLDKTMIEYGWSLAPYHRIYRGQSKYLLRQLALKWLPPSIACGKKMGFGVPLASWLRHELRDWAESLLTSQRLQDVGFNAATIRTLWDEHISEKRDVSSRLWNTLMLLHWHGNGSSG